MLDELKAFIENEKLLHSDDRILVGVSGGVDSMVLVTTLSALGYYVEVAHMNYQLRGEDSNEDEKFVSTWCAERGIDCHSKRVDLSRADLSTQMEARKLRYEWFEEILEQHRLTKVATAHHLNDSLETVLLNLTKGTGLSGLKGILNKRDNIRRPLLRFTKTQILEYAKREAITWREDKSNQKSDYQRNLIRNEVIPKLMEINPSLIETFAHTSDRIESVNIHIDKKVSAIDKSVVWDEYPTKIPLDWCEKDKGDVEILYRLLRRYKASYSMIGQILSADEVGKVFHTSEHLICLDREALIVTELQNSDNRLLSIEGVGVYQWGVFEAVVSCHEKNDEITRLKNIAEFDFDKINWPLKVRGWEQGDVFVPLGMKGKKKVSDFMIDVKIPVTLKRDVPIFLSDTRILWVGGFRIDDRHKVTEETKKILRIELKRNG